MFSHTSHVSASSCLNSTSTEQIDKYSSSPTLCDDVIHRSGRRVGGGNGVTPSPTPRGSPLSLFPSFKDNPGLPHNNLYKKLSWTHPLLLFLGYAVRDCFRGAPSLSASGAPGSPIARDIIGVYVRFNTLLLGKYYSRGLLAVVRGKPL